MRKLRCMQLKFPPFCLGEHSARGGELTASPSNSATDCQTERYPGMKTTFAMRHFFYLPNNLSKMLSLYLSVYFFLFFLSGVLARDLLSKFFI
jgi:hypothetical protein